VRNDIAAGPVGHINALAAFGTAARVKSEMEVLIESNYAQFASKNVMILTNLTGAPFVNDSWYEDMRALEIPNTNCRSSCFEPVFDKFMHETCCGLQCYWSLNCAEDYERFDAVYVRVALWSTAKRLYGDPTRNAGNFTWLEADDVYDVDLLTGGPLILESIDAGLNPEAIEGRWQDGLERFKTRRKQYLLY
jgi:uncharacterized protein YbbC (DUF1343 family)